MREEHGLPQDRDAERGETANRVDDPSATQAAWSSKTQAKAPTRMRCNVCRAAIPSDPLCVRRRTHGAPRPTMAPGGRDVVPCT